MVGYASGDDPILNIVPLVADLAAAGIVLDLNDRRELVVHGRPDAALAERIVACAQLLVWEVTARETGHGWAACDHCGKALLTAAKRPKSKPWPRCRMTPRCEGHHRPPAPPDTRAAAALLPG